MNLVEFCRLHNAKQNTVSMYISNHKEEFDGHIIKIAGKKGVELDDTAYQLLEEQYPLPTKIEVVEDSYTRDQVLELQKALLEEQRKVQELQQKLIGQMAENSDLSAKALLLEDREHQIESKNEELKIADEEKANLLSKLSESEKNADSLQRDRQELIMRIEHVAELPFWKRKKALQQLAKEGKEI